MKRGKPEPDPWGFLKPFTSFTWLGIILSGFVISLLILTAVMILNKRLSIIQYATIWTENFFDIVGVFTSQGKQRMRVC